MADLAKIKLPSGNEYNIKDAVARSAIESLNSFDYVVCSLDLDTPSQISFTDAGSGEIITGLLVASADTMHRIYLVPADNEEHNGYDEYITVAVESSPGQDDTLVYSWEKIGSLGGSTVDLSGYLTTSAAATTYAAKSDLGNMAYILPSDAFKGNSEITSYINNNVIAIVNGIYGDTAGTMGVDPTGAFYSCPNLSIVSLPNCSNVGDAAFYNCTSLKNVNAPNCTYIGSAAFYKTSIIAATFPKCKSIDYDAFNSCQSLFVADFSACETIWTNAFANCNALELTTFDNCLNIGYEAFASCTRLSTIRLPKIKCISTGAFYNCLSLQTLSLPGSEYCIMQDSNALSGTKIANGTGSIYVPASMLSTYQTMNYWSYYSERFAAIPGTEVANTGAMSQLTIGSTTLTEEQLIELLEGSGGNTIPSAEGVSF